jgi:type II secretory pathway pseudopilin PulG
MKVVLIIFSFLLVVVSSAVSTAFEVDKAARQETKLTVNKAEKIAINEFRRRSKGTVTRISASLLEDNDREWVFVVENAEQEPSPGSELYVTINKRTAKVESYFGK